MMSSSGDLDGGTRCLRRGQLASEPGFFGDGQVRRARSSRKKNRTHWTAFFLRE